jgi:hypothetical protein
MACRCGFRHDLSLDEFKQTEAPKHESASVPRAESGLILMALRIVLSLIIRLMCFTCKAEQSGQCKAVLPASNCHIAALNSVSQLNKLAL